MIRRRVSVATAATVLALLVPTFPTVQQVSTASVSLSGRSASAPSPIRVATFNVQSPRTGAAWKPRRAKVLSLVREAKADVLVLQEGEDGGPYGDVESGFPARWIARKAGLTMAGTQGDVSYGVYSTARGPHVLFSDRRFEQVLTSCSFDSASKTKWVTLRDRRSGRQFRVAAVHLPAGGSKATLRERAGAIRTTARQMARCDRRTGSLPAVWAGDFNSVDRSQARVLSSRGFADSFRIAGRTVRGDLNTLNGRRRIAASDGRHIDQIWVSRGVRVERWVQVARVSKGRYVGRFASDHNPVVARVRIPR